MPIQVMTVERVDPCTTVNPSVTSYLVFGADTTTALGLQVQTICAWRAALCSRALETQQPIRVTWADSRYGKKLVEVELT